MTFEQVRNWVLNNDGRREWDSFEQFAKAIADDLGGSPEDALLYLKQVWELDFTLTEQDVADILKGDKPLEEPKM